MTEVEQNNASSHLSFRFFGGGTVAIPYLARLVCMYIYIYIYIYIPCIGFSVPLVRSDNVLSYIYIYIYYGVQHFIVCGHRNLTVSIYASVSAGR